MSSIDLVAYRPILDVVDNFVFASNGNVVACFNCNMPEIYSQSEKDYEALHAIWFQALKSLPNGTLIHKMEVYRKKEFGSDSLPTGTFLSDATRVYFDGREYIDHQSYLFLTLSKKRLLNSSKLVNPFKKVGDKLLLPNDNELHKFKIAVSDTVSFVNNHKMIGISPMSRDAILEFSSTYFNGFNTDLDTAMELGKGPIQIGENFFDMLAINSELCFGQNVQTSIVNEKFTSDDFVFHQGFMDGLGLDLHENHVVNQILYLDDKHKWRKVLDKKIEELQKSSNFGSQNKVTLKKVQVIRDQINNDDSSRVIRGHNNIIYWGNDRKALSEIGSQIKSVLKEIDVTGYSPSNQERKNYYLNSHPCFASNFSNEDLYVLELKHALCLLINNTNYASDEKGVLFNDRKHNILVFKDVWDEGKRRIKARNFAIFAPTGEGKSFLANNILRQYFEEGVRLVIIDLGGSYTKFAQLYSEDYLVLRYESGKNLGINPFYVSNFQDVTPEHLEDLAVFLFELLFSELKVTKAQSVSLKKILKYYYQQTTEKHSLSSFHSFLKRQKEQLLTSLDIDAAFFNMTNFLHILSEYVEDGLYSFLFEINEDKSYRLEDKRLIVFELDEVKDNKEILSVMLKLIKTAIQRTIWKNRNEKGVILFDEFAKQLKFPNVLESVEFYYQAIRKQEGAIGIILQSINQLPNNSTSASILENTQVIYSLNNEKGYGELVKRLNLSSHDLNQLKSIKNNFSGPRKYTEIFIKIGKESNVFRLEVPPEVYAAYLTDGAENDRIMRIYKECGCMETAIKKFVKRSRTTF